MGLLVERSEGILAITLNRPEVLNAIDPETRAELRQVMQEFRSDSKLRVALLTGAGDRGFCTGSDLKKTFPGTDSFASEYFGGGEPPFSSLLDVPKPIVCAINGVAMGGGLELALACDIRIAVEGARFALPEVRIGSIPGGGGTQRLLQAMPRAVAMKLLLTGEAITAEEALRWGLVSDLVPRSELMPLAWRLSRTIAANAPLSVGAVKVAARASSDLPLDWGLAVEQLAFGALRDTEDRLEGRKAFTEKRPPVFRGR